MKPVFVVIAIYSSNVITSPFTCCPSLFVKIVSDKFVVTMFVLLWMVHRFTTSSFLDVMQIIARCTIQTIEEISLWTHTPSVWSIKKNFRGKCFRCVWENAFSSSYRKLSLISTLQPRMIGTPILIVRYLSRVAHQFAFLHSLPWVR
jgi:hypothetical protein